MFSLTMIEYVRMSKSQKYANKLGIGNNRNKLLPPYNISTATLSFALY